MSQNNSNAKTAMLAKLDSIHKVEGFDPSPFAVDYTDLNTQETRKRLPVMIQMAWFRLKYPEAVSPSRCRPARIVLWQRRASIPATRTRLTAISQKLQRQGGRMPPSHLCHRGNGRRRQR